jgi:two-component sensor histidine kinase
VAANISFALDNLEMEAQNKRVEQALRASLEEKTALLKEVHHRVKNNLQVVSSMINLQADRVKNAVAVDALKDTQNRVRSMALLHEMLYQSHNLSRVDFAAYIESLCAHLFRAITTDPGRVCLERHVDVVELNLEQAVPCGLIISELVSNALKYAFPENRAGRITIELRAQAGQTIDLTVADDGVGLPDHVTLGQTTTLGLQLVSILVSQLNGTLVVEREKGSIFHLLFPAHPTDN